MKKIKLSDLKQFENKTGIKVERRPKPSDNEEQLVFSVSEKMSGPFMAMLEELVTRYSQTQDAVMAMSANKDLPLTAEVVERDERGNISQLTFTRDKVTH